MVHSVAKFGGSSVANAKVMGNCVQILKENPSFKIVVVSATSSTTAELEEILRLTLTNTSNNLCHQLFERHRQIGKELNCDQETIKKIDIYENKLLDILESIKAAGSCLPEVKDKILSTGEKLSTLLFEQALVKHGYKKSEIAVIPAEQLIFTNAEYGKAVPLFSKIKSNAKNLIPTILETKKIILTQGYLGISPEGNVTTLGKEGSDYSAALLAAATEATEVVIWTDVAGISTLDPRLVPEAAIIAELSFEQATLLARSGAKVLFPETLAPLRETKICCKVKKTTEPHLVGTKIYAQSNNQSSPLAMAIYAESETDYVITLIGNEMENFQLDEKILDLLKNKKTSYGPCNSTEHMCSFKICTSDFKSDSVLIHNFYFKDQKCK